MEKLRKLDLSDNMITRLEADQFPTLLHLQRLKLSNCLIRYVHNYAFRNLPNITAIGSVKQGNAVSITAIGSVKLGNAMNIVAS